MAGDAGTDEGGFKLYHYTPSFAGAVIFAVLFSAASIRHVHIIIRKKTWFFVPFLVGCLFEAVGYAARAYSSKQTPDWTLMPYIMQSLLILLGPAFFAASIYMLLGRIIVLLDAEQHSLIPTKWLTKLFLLGDILSIFGQGGGGGLLASSSSKSSQDLGNTVILLGLGIQVAFFTGFMVVTSLFHLHINRRPTVQSRASLAPWKPQLRVLYLVSALIMVRSLFRMIEYAQGHNGSLIKKEIYVYLLDALLMIAVAAVFAVFHPSKLFEAPKVFATDEEYGSGRDSIPIIGRNRYHNMG